MTSPRPVRLRNTIRPYAWGSRTFIAGLQGRPVPAPGPEAEMWLGTHPGAPSFVDAPETETRSETLAESVARDPRGQLGASVATRFSDQLPYLMKILAAAEPLSLQAHPSRAQAETGFAAENAAGVALTDPARCYKDRGHKPELIVALTPFSALYGFRRVSETRRLFTALNVAELGPWIERLEQPAPNALRTVFRDLFALAPSEQRHLSHLVVTAAAEENKFADDFSVERHWTRRLGDLYPGDIGIVCALLLNVVRLQPYEALYLPAGNLHAYLDGAGIEIMASSDNVLRGGLTPKTVNVPELLRVVTFDELPPAPLHALPGPDGECIYPTPTEEFQLSCLPVGVGQTVSRQPAGPEILLVTEGRLELTTVDGSLSLGAGESAFVPANVLAYAIRGAGRCFRAQVPPESS